MPKAAPRILRLTLKRRWFDMISTGEKTEEYRTPSPWLDSRLIGRDYDAVEFANGYGTSAPKVTVQWLGWSRGFGKRAWGALPGRIYIVIRLGQIIANAEASQPTRYR